MTEEHKRKISEAMKRYARSPRGQANLLKAGKGNAGKPKPWRSGDKHPMWRGDEVGYFGLHSWVRKTLGKATSCARCFTKDSPLYDWANISHEYRRDPADWMPLCRSCHQKYDNARAKQWISRKRNKLLKENYNA